MNTAQYQSFKTVRYILNLNEFTASHVAHALRKIMPLNGAVVYQVKGASTARWHFNYRHGWDIYVPMPQEYLWMKASKSEWKLHSVRTRLKGGTLIHTELSWILFSLHYGDKICLAVALVHRTSENGARHRKFGHECSNKKITVR